MEQDGNRRVVLDPQQFSALHWHMMKWITLINLPTIITLIALQNNGVLNSVIAMAGILGTLIGTTIVLAVRARRRIRAAAHT